MLFTLKEHQVDAVAQILQRFRVAKSGYERDGMLTQFSLSAATAAGKTVICAAVAEALFFGSEDFGVDPDPGATVLWFSDDPPLNVQSMSRFNQASEKLNVGRTRIIPATFSERVFAPNVVYFLNAQKLQKGGLLVRGAKPSTAGPGGTDDLVAPDLYQQTIYDVIRNTIQTPGRTLYMILDEAHRGMRPSDRDTIVRRLINGTETTPPTPLPIVMGLSATVELFDKAMDKMVDRHKAPPVKVDSAEVLASGLLKAQIDLHLPKEVGAFDTSMLTQAVKQTRAFEAAWDEYTSAQGLERVFPLMVLQVPDKASKDYLKTVLDVIGAEWPQLRRDGIAHVFGEHTSLQVDFREIPYVEPHRVQDEKWIRVLLAKEAVSTGWDCPRAEVLVSFRPKRDETAVHQLFGRMMRPPLARRVTGNDFLNSVACYVPLFDQETAEDVAEILQQGDADPSPGPKPPKPGPRVLFAPVDLGWNPLLPAEQVAATLETLPSYTIPYGQGAPMRRLDRLVVALTQDFPGSAVAQSVKKTLVNIVHAAAVRYADEVEAAKKDVLTLTVQRLTGAVGADGRTLSTYEVPADGRAVRETFLSSARLLTLSVANGYASTLLQAQGEDEDIMDVEATVAAVGRVPKAVDYLHEEAATLARDLHAEYAARIAGLPDNRQDEYTSIEALSVTPERMSIKAPTNWRADTKVRTYGARAADGNVPVIETPISAFPGHLLATDGSTDADTDKAKHVYPVELNDWEKHVLQVEQEREEHVAWYRNPARGDREALVIPWQDGTQVWHGLRPDFVFFARRADGTLGASVVDPHGHHLADALPKLRAMADYAEEHGAAFMRIISVAETKGAYRTLDMKSARVREAVREATDALSLYLDEDLARDYR